MWALHESYDPAERVLYLFLVAESAEPPKLPRLDTPQLVESFAELETARRFVEGYQESLACGKDRVVRRVRCGRERLRGCLGPGKPCCLGLDGYRCEIRES